jgi:hypothetical protein
VQASRENNGKLIPSADEQITLPYEDRNRMTRLYEEVVARLEEMAMITARTLRINPAAGFSVRFSPLSEGVDEEFTAAEIVSTLQGCGCYDYRQGACYRTAPK